MINRPVSWRIVGLCAIANSKAGIGPSFFPWLSAARTLNNEACSMANSPSHIAPKRTEINKPNGPAMKCTMSRSVKTRFPLIANAYPNNRLKTGEKRQKASSL